MHFTLADLVTDITQNAAESGADIVELQISETADSTGKGEFRFVVRDNGKGMTSEEIKRVEDPFVTDGIKHPNRKVGLGLPFLIQTAEQSGGGWKIESKKKPENAVSSEAAAPADSKVPVREGFPYGTSVSGWFDLGNVDAPPVGDIPGMLRTVLLFNGPSEMVIGRLRETAGGGTVNYEVRKTELADALGDLEDVQSLILLDQYLRSLEE